MLKIIQKIKGKQSRKCTEADLPNIRALALEIKDLCGKPLLKCKGGALAIAHCQVDQNDPMRFFVMQDGSVVINPSIREYRGKPIRNNEGCMSFADCPVQIGVMRHKKIVVNCITLASPDAEEEERVGLEVTGTMAYVFQHEVDHMNGKHIFSNMIK